MKLSIYDPFPFSNEYFSKMYAGPLRSYCADHGIEREELEDLDSSKDKIIVICGDHLSHDRIERLKSAGNKLVVFDINDSSYISSTYCSSPLWTECDLIFKISGVPNRNETIEPGIDEHFNITTAEVKYLPDERWETFNSMRLGGKIKSLPYALWGPLVQPDYVPPTQEQRNGKVLVGGGNHFWRVILFFKLVQRGMNDPSSQFSTNAYFAEDMVPRFRYCEACRDERKVHGKTPYNAVHDPSGCMSPGKWGTEGDIAGGPGTDKPQFGLFNNVCPAAFFWFSKEYERLSGPLNDSIERALNGTFRPSWEFTQSLSSASYYADFKWLSTIYLPPRFWEAASVGTPSFYPQRTAHQDYWPHVEEDVHYYTFPENMSDFGLDPSNMPPKHWQMVSNEAKNLYETKIRGTQYPISTALLEHVVSSIEESCL